MLSVVAYAMLLLGLCLLLYLVAVPTTLLAQSPVYVHYGVENGLAGTTVYRVFQDSKGFIWVGTEQGLSLYDGHSFRNFTTEQGLYANDVFSMAEDASGKIWLSCYHSPPLYIENNLVHNHFNDVSLQQFRPFLCDWLCTEAQRDDIWMQCGAVYNLKSTGAVESYDSIQGKGIEGACRLQGITILYSDTKLYLLGDNNERQEVDIQKYIGRYKNEDGILQVLRGGANSLHLITNTYASYCFRFQQGRVASFHKGPRLTPCYQLTRIDENTFFLNSRNNGVEVLDSNLQTRKDLPRYLPHQPVLYSTKDREGNLWFCTASEGLYMLPNRRFTLWNRDNGLLFDNVKSMVLGKDSSLYLAYANSSFQILHRGATATKNNTVYTKMQGRISTGVKAGKTVYFGGEYGIVAIDPKKRIQRFHPPRNIKGLGVARDGSLIAANHLGVFRLTPNSFRVLDTIYNSRTTCICVLDDGECWIGTLSGVQLRSLPHTQPKDRHATISRIPDALQHASIVDISHIANTNMVVATSHSGLYILSPDTVYHLEERSGLSSNICKKIWVDGDSLIWVCTNMGVNIITPQQRYGKLSFKVENITQFNGLPTNDVNQIVGDASTIWISTSRGVVSFPRANEKYQSVPPVYITAIKAVGKQYSVHSVLSFPQDSSLIEISFAGLSYSSCGNVEYKYRMNGVEQDWQYTRNPTLRYAGLSPGQYDFCVYAKNAANVWSDTPARIVINIRSAWWQTRLFQLSAMLAFLSISYYAYRFKKKRDLKLQAEEFTRKLTDMELRVVKAQFNPHFIFNSLNSLQYFIHRQDVETAERYLTHFSKLIRRTLELSNRHQSSLSEEKDYLQHYLHIEQMRFHSQFEYRIEDRVDGAEHIMIPAMLLQPYVENALRHGIRQKRDGKGLLILRFYSDNVQHILEVDDNGIGRTAALALRKQQHIEYQSKGMELAVSKLEIFRRQTGVQIQLEIIDKVGENGIAEGTTIRITIPKDTPHDKRHTR